MTNTDESAQSLPTPADDQLGDQDWQPTIGPDDWDVREAVDSYVTSMLWANACCDVESCTDGREIGDCEHTDGVEYDYDLSDFSADDQTSIVADVYAMIAGSAESERDFLAYCQKRSASDFGHDFALTRNGHGAGFWDRGLGALGDRLSDAAKVYGESSAYVDEDGVTLS